MYVVTLLPLVYGGYWAPSIIFYVTSILMLKHPSILIKLPEVSLLLIGLLFVGVSSYFMTDQITAINFFRDLLIVINIISLYVSGYWIGRTNWNTFVNAIKFSAVCYSFFYLIKFGYLLSTSGLDISNAQSYRIQMGAGEFVVAIGMYFYIADPRRHSFYFSALLLTTMLLTQSRTMLIYLAVLLFMAANLRTYRKQRKLFIILVILQIIIVSVLFFSYTPNLLYAQSSGSLIGKLQGSLVEILPAYHDKTEVGYFWRGFETYVALEVFNTSNTYQFLFGRGMGFAIPLPYEMTLAGNSFIELPFLHNGYATVLVKFGVFGLLLYATFLLLQLRVAFRDEFRVLYTATILFTIFATLLMAGPFEKNDFTHVTILLGALYGRSSGVRRALRHAQRQALS